MNCSAFHGCVWWQIFWHYLPYSSIRFFNIAADYTWNIWFSYQKKFLCKRATKAMFLLWKQPDGRCIFLKTSKAEDHQNVMCIHIAICRKTSFWKMGRTGLKFCASYIIRASHDLHWQKQQLDDFINNCNLVNICEIHFQNTIEYFIDDFA